MIFESIQLNHVGPFIEPVSIGPLSTGLNILAAANESGKTTLIKAATRTLFDKHTCKDQEIKLLQPVGSDLAPQIMVVFQIAAGRFRIEKTFLLTQKCLLSEWKSGGWQTVAEGDAADKRLMALLKSSQPGHGASNEAHWGLMRYLWARQGEPAAWPEWGGEAGQLIQDRLAKVELDPFIDRLRASLWDDYLQVFTATGQTKASGSLKKAEDELAQIDSQLIELQSKRRQLERLQSDFQNLACQVALRQIESSDKQKEAVEARESVGRAELLSFEMKAKHDALENAKVTLRTVDQDSQTVAKLRSDLDETTTLLDATQSQANQLHESEASLSHKQAQADAALDTHQIRLTKIRSDLDRVQKLIKHRRTRKDFEQLESLSKKVGSQSSRQKELRDERAKLPDLTQAKLNKLENAQDSLREKKAQLEALGLTVELLPDERSEVLLSESKEERSVSLEAKQPKTFKAAQSLELKLAGWGRLTIRSGSDELKDLVKELREEEAAFKERSIELGVESVEQARMALSAGKDLDQQIHTARDALKELLADWESAEKFEQELNASRTRLHSLEATLNLTEAETQESVADIEATEQRLGVQVEQQQHDAKQLEKIAKIARTELGSAREKRAEVEKQMSGLKSKIQGIEEQMQNLLARYPQGIDETKAAAQQTFVEAQAHLEVTKKRLPPDYEKLPERNKHASKAAQEVAAELESERAKYNQMEGQLKFLGSEGLYSRETALLERREIVSHTAETDRARGWATRLLHALIENRKLAATRSVLAPLEARLSSAFAEITGDHYRQVFLDESLQIRGIGRHQNELVEFRALSQGAKEQLLLALRLAIAAELADHEPQLLILDDVLVNTDHARQNRVLDVLRTAAEKLQILILTCHPDRYRGIGLALTIAKQPEDR